MQVVSQVSLPMRIALVGTLAFLALWMVALRPKPPAPEPAAATPPPAASPESAPGKAAAQAQQAAGASQESAAKSEAAADAASGDATGTSAGTGTATPAQTADQSAANGAGAVDVKIDAKTPKPARVVLNDILDGKVAVLLFWDRRLTDDKAVHKTVKGLDRRGGKVVVHVASIRDLAQYEPITRGVPVVTSPTVLVIDRAGRARSVGGLTVPRELEELVGKALRVKP
jgi:hypothetical protein